MNKYLFSLSFIFLLNTTCYADSDRMKPYPAPELGISKRMVINLPLLADEDTHKLELIIGKTIKVDCNHHWLGGQLTEEVAKGWGYTYFILKSVQGPASTLMACPPEMKEQTAFVQVRGDGNLLRYNSKLPIVVYVPIDFEVHYKIWAASKESELAKEE